MANDQNLLTFKNQLLPTNKERRLWGRMVDGYKDAYGTGSSYLDPDAIDLDVTTGAMWMLAPIDWHELKYLWVFSGLDTDHPDSGWHLIEQKISHSVHVSSYKVKKGFFAKSIWIGYINFIINNKNMVHTGYIVENNILGFFESFDGWKAEDKKLHHNVSAFIKM